MIIGLIGLGEMGSEIGRYLVMNDLEVISVYEGRSEISKKRASKYKIRDAGSIEQFCKISDLVISIIPPDKAVETANLYTSFKNKDGGQLQIFKTKKNFYGRKGLSTIIFS